MGISQSQHILEAEDRCSNKKRIPPWYVSQQTMCFLNAISVYPSVPVKAPFLPGGHLQATLPLSSPSCRVSVQLIPKDRLQRPQENHWAYLIQHWINLLLLWEGNKAQFGPGGTVRARREVPCTSSALHNAYTPSQLVLPVPPCITSPKNAAFSYFVHLFIIFLLRKLAL